MINPAYLDKILGNVAPTANVVNTIHDPEHAGIPD